MLLILIVLQSTEKNFWGILMKKKLFLLVDYLKNLKLTYNSIFLVSCQIIIFLFSIFCLSFVGFLVHIPINPFYMIFALVISFLSVHWINRSTSNSVSDIVTSSGIFILSFLLSFLIGGLFFNDISWDGRAYHQPAIYFLKMGWNPVYVDLENFVSKVISPIYSCMWANHVWIENYPKFCEIVGADFYTVFKNLETGKMLNLLLSFNLFYLSCFTISKFKNIKLWQNIVISFLLIFNPVCVYQISTFYIDLIVYYLFINVVLLMFLKDTGNISTKLFNILTIMNFVMLINVKLGGVFYFVVMSFVFFVYSLITKDKNNLKSLLIIFISVVLLGLLSGINPYFTNINKDRHPLYPLQGEGKLDIISPCTPEFFKGKSPLYKLFLSTFGVSKNIYGVDSEIKTLNLKLPFTIAKDESKFKYIPDMRIGGFGYFWSGILLLSLVLMLMTKNANDETKKGFYLITSILIASILLNPEAWWARYAPQFWALPLFLILFRLNNLELKKACSIYVYVLVLIIFINSAIIEDQIFSTKHKYGYNVKKSNKDGQIAYIYEDETASKTVDPMFYLFLDERNIKYKIVDKTYYEKYKSEFELPPYAMTDRRKWRIANDE